MNTPEEIQQHAYKTLDRFVDDFFDTTLDRIHHNTGLQARKHERGEYQCIYLPSDIFMRGMAHIVSRLKESAYKSSFVDAGCGTGHKLVLAAAFGFGDITGFDIEPNYLRIARRYIKRFGGYRVWLEQRPKARLKDILTADYSKFDVIYFYHPFRDPDKEKAFEHRVVETAKSGAIIFGASNSSLGLFKNLTCITPKDAYGYSYLYQKDAN